MIAALALLAISGGHPLVKPVPSPTPVVRVMRSSVPTRMLSVIQPRDRAAAVCAAHLELLMEKLSARSEEPDASFMMVQEYWQDLLPDPESAEAISDEAFTGIKESLDASAQAEPQVYLAGLQECVMVAARGGALNWHP